MAPVSSVPKGEGFVVAESRPAAELSALTIHHCAAVWKRVVACAVAAGSAPATVIGGTSTDARITGEYESHGRRRPLSSVIGLDNDRQLERSPNRNRRRWPDHERRRCDGGSPRHFTGDGGYHDTASQIVGDLDLDGGFPDAS
jgi:hypothetical protein